MYIILYIPIDGSYHPPIFDDLEWFTSYMLSSPNGKYITTHKMDNKIIHMI